LYSCTIEKIKRRESNSDCLILILFNITLDGDNNVVSSNLNYVLMKKYVNVSISIGNKTSAL